jgi:ubiquinone/menaquinone biosynthesis C-methylase UbiE
MQNREQWSPGKYVIRNGRLRSTRDSSKLKTASRLVTDLVAARYDEAIRTYARGDLIDLGCGNVPLFLAYKDRVNSVTCVDWPATRHKVDHLDHELDLTENLPFPDNTYSTIILSDVLEHIPSPGQLLSEMHRILAPGGVAIINTPFLYWVHEAPHDYYRYTEYALQRFANDAGFRVISLEPIGGLPEVLADFIAKKPRVIPIIGHLFRKSTSILIQKITWVFVHSLGKSLSRKTSKRFPMGYFMIVEKQQ